MPLSWGAIIRLLLEGAVEWLKWQVVKTQIELKTLLIDRKEKYEDEAERIQGQIDDLRLAGRHDRADELYNQLLGRTEWVANLSTEMAQAQEGNDSPDTGGPIHHTDGGNVGEPRPISPA